MHPLIAEWLEQRKIVEEAELIEQALLGRAEDVVERPEYVRRATRDDIVKGAIVWVYGERWTRSGDGAKRWYWQHIDRVIGNEGFLGHDGCNFPLSMAWVEDDRG